MPEGIKPNKLSNDEFIAFINEKTDEIINLCIRRAFSKFKQFSGIDSPDDFAYNNEVKKLFTEVENSYKNAVETAIKAINHP